MEDLYALWCEKAMQEKELREDLQKMKENGDLKEECFGGQLAFCNGQLAGLAGAGPNRMNSFTVGRAVQGLADYLRIYCVESGRRASVALAYGQGSRVRSYARAAAQVLAGNGLDVYLYSHPMPEKSVPYSILAHGSVAGIMFTTIHQPESGYGLRVYRADGERLTGEASALIASQIDQVNLFQDVKQMQFTKGLTSFRIRYLCKRVQEETLEYILKKL